MFKKLLSFALACSLIGLVTPVPTAHAQSQADREAQADKARARVVKLGTGKQARVEVRLTDNTKLKGYIGAIDEDHFTLVDSKRGAVRQIPYAQVQQIKNINHSAIYAALFGAAIIGGVIIFVLIAARGA